MEGNRYYFVRRRSERPGIYIPSIKVRRVTEGSQQKLKHDRRSPRVSVVQTPQRAPAPDVRALGNNYFETGEGRGDLKFLLEEAQSRRRRRRQPTRDWSSGESTDGDDSSSSDSDSSSDSSDFDYVLRARDRRRYHPVVPPNLNHNRPPPPPPGVILHTGPGPGEYEAAPPQASPANLNYNRPPPPSSAILHTGPGPGEYVAAPQQPTGAAGGPAVINIEGPQYGGGPPPPPLRPPQPPAPGILHAASGQYGPGRPGGPPRAPGHHRRHGYSDTGNARRSDRARPDHQVVPQSRLGSLLGESQGLQTVKYGLLS
jgi:hypothetical protein